MLLPKSLLLQHSTTKAVYDPDFRTLILQLKRELMLLSVGIGTAWSGYCLITLSVQVISHRKVKHQYFKFKKCFISDLSLASLTEVWIRNEYEDLVTMAQTYFLLYFYIFSVFDFTNCNRVGKFFFSSLLYWKDSLFFLKKKM